jgi:hypothetical protein
MIGNFSRRAQLIAAAVVAGAAIVIVFAFCRSSPTPLPEKERASSDSLHATRPDYQATRDTLVVRETTYVHASTQDRARAAIAEHVADSLRDLSRRWQDAAIAQGDTVSRWYDIARVEQREADSLRSANAELHHATTNDTAAMHAADLRADAAERRLAATDDLRLRLERDLKAASPPCRIAHFFGCPSRKAVFLGGVVLGAAGTYVVTHRSQFAGVLP